MKNFQVKVQDILESNLTNAQLGALMRISALTAKMERTPSIQSMVKIKYVSQGKIASLRERLAQTTSEILSQAVTRKQSRKSDAARKSKKRVEASQQAILGKRGQPKDLITFLNVQNNLKKNFQKTQANVSDRTSHNFEQEIEQTFFDLRKKIIDNPAGTGIEAKIDNLSKKMSDRTSGIFTHEFEKTFFDLGKKIINSCDPSKTSHNINAPQVHVKTVSCLEGEEHRQERPKSYDENFERKKVQHSKKEMYPKEKEKGYINIPQKEKERVKLDFLSQEFDGDTLISAPMQLFEQLWAHYPRKRGKKAAARHFSASVTTQKDFKNICAALSNLLDEVKTEETPLRFIPHGATWFNNWEDWIPEENHCQMLNASIPVEFQKFSEKFKLNMFDQKNYLEALEPLPKKVVAKLLGAYVRKASKLPRIADILKDIEEADFIEFWAKFKGTYLNYSKGLQTPDDVFQVKHAIGHDIIVNMDKKSESYIKYEVRRVYRLYKLDMIEEYVPEKIEYTLLDEGEKEQVTEDQTPLDIAALNYEEMVQQYKKND